MEGVETAAERDTHGRWVPGRSGNPAGKRPGTRNRSTVLRAFLREGETEAAARAIIDKAVAGHLAAARWVIDGIAPKPRGRLIALDLPDDASFAEAMDHVVRLMARGEITLEEAQGTIKLLRDRAVVCAEAPRPAEVPAEPAPPAAPSRRDRRAARAPAAASPASDLHLQAPRLPLDAHPRAGLAAALRGSTALTPPRAAPPERRSA